MKKTLSGSTTQKDVAELAGVSSAVVSYVINNGPRQVSPETRMRVLNAIETLGYRPNKYAQALGKNESVISDRQIGIIVGGSSAVLQRPFYASLLAGIYDEVNKNGSRIRFMHFWNDLKDTVLFNEHIHAEEVSSLILLAADLMRIDPDHMALIHRIEERVNNVVCLDTPINNFTTITFDRVAAARLVVEHLIALGHRRIAFVGNAGRRVTGFQQTLILHGIPLRPNYIQHPGVFNSPAEGCEGAKRLLELPDPPTAIFAASDEVAIGVIGAIQSVGLEVPRDVSVASIDNIPIAPYVYPALTTVHVPTNLMGVQAMHVLSMQRSSPSVQGTTIVVDTQLTVRQSTGAPP
jgi:DNA-binding LacI/PurR family transcriptional regulator